MRYQMTAKKVLFALLFGSALLAIPLPAGAANAICGTSSSSGVSGGLSELCQNSSGITDAGINISNKQDVTAVIARVIDWALYLSGAIAVIFVIVGGYRYLTAGGSEETATKARQTVINALIGLVIIILAYVIVNAVASFIQS